MKLGLVARADQRGIGIMTAEFYNHVDVDKVLIVSHGQWPQDLDQYGDGTPVVALNMRDLSLDEHTCRTFLEGLDVVYCVETLYDWRFKSWAEDAGCRVVIHGMPELYSARDHKDGRPHPDKWLWPTPWLIDDGVLPEGPLLPVPCVDYPNVAARHDDDGPLRVLHVAGVRAAEDRNGTLTLMEALSRVREHVHATIITQDRGLPRPLPNTPNNVSVTVLPGGLDSRWLMYHDQHVLVLPRKYGGLCLPALEAMTCGLAVALPSVEPNEIWPIEPIRAHGMTGHLAPYGYVPSANISPYSVARTIDLLAADRNLLETRQLLASGFAVENSWSNLHARYMLELSLP